MTLWETFLESSRSSNLGIDPDTGLSVRQHELIHTRKRAGIVVVVVVVFVVVTVFVIVSILFLLLSLILWHSSTFWFKYIRLKQL